MKYFLVKCFPLLTSGLSVWILIVCVSIINETGKNTFFFNILAFQVYLNWIAILLANRDHVGDKSDRLFSSVMPENYSDISEKSKYLNTIMDNDKRKIHKLKSFNHRNSRQNYVSQDYLIDEDSLLYSSENVGKLWYCHKCCIKSKEMCRHCSICSKCIIGRDHHCFLLGTCIGKQNMKHFIVLLFYTSLACLYTHILLCSQMNLYNESWHVIFQHLFPISFTKWLIGQEYVGSLLDILLMNLTASMALFSFIFSVYYLYNNSGIYPVNDLTSNKLISVKFRCIYKGGFSSALLNMLFPVTLLNYFPIKLNQ